MCSGPFGLGSADVAVHHGDVSALLAHLAAGRSPCGHGPTFCPRRVVPGFSDTPRDSRLVITQEWIAGALRRWFIAAATVVATALGGTHQAFGEWVYRSSAVLLIAFAVLTAATARVPRSVFFKICPVLLGACAARLLAAGWV